MRLAYTFGPIEIYRDESRPNGWYFARMKFWEVVPLPYRDNVVGAEREGRRNERTLEVILAGAGANKAREKVMKELCSRGIPLKRVQPLEVVSYVQK